MKKKKITKSFSNLVDHRNRFSTFGDVTPDTVTPVTVKPINISSEELLINAEKFIKEWLLPTKAFFDMNGMKLDVKLYCEQFLDHYGMNNTEMLNEVLKLCKKYGLF
jgi:hypothetical protein